MEQIDSLEISLCIYGQLIFDKEAKHTQGEKIASSINDVGKTR